MRDDRERLLDIKETIERIEKYAVQGWKSFEDDELIQNWIVHHLQILGEAARSISSEFKNNHAEIPWKKITGMRHILVHDYFGIDLDVVWSVIENDLPSLKKQISCLLPILK